MSLPLLLRTPKKITSSDNGVLERLGLDPNKVAFFVSNRAGRKGMQNLLLHRRSSDSKTTFIPYRPKIAYDAIRNEIHYNPATWQEWTPGSGITIDSVGMKYTADGASYIQSTINGNFKPSTRYGFLYDVAEVNVTQNFVIANGYAFTNGTVLGKILGLNKVVLTSVANIVTNKLCMAIGGGAEPAGKYLKLRDIRVFELPTGSQIEADFTNLTADQLAAKYPMVDANGAPYGAPAGVQRDRVCNEFVNGDGRYGLLGCGATYGILSPIKGGMRNIGSGEANLQYSYFQKGSGYSYLTSATRKYYIRGLFNTPNNLTSAQLASFNGTTTKSVDIRSQVTAGMDSWAHAIITQTDLGTGNGYVSLRMVLSYVDALTQNGKILDTKWVTIVNMGDSVADPLYSKDADGMYAWLQTAKGVQRTPDGGFYLPSYGLCEGEEDLDIKANFGGSSQLYATDEKNQGKYVTSLDQIWSNGNFAVDSNADGLADGLVKNGPSVVSLAGGIQRFRAINQWQGLKIVLLNLVIGKTYAFILDALSVNNSLRVEQTVGVYSYADYTGGGNWQRFGLVVTATATFGEFRFIDSRASGFTEHQITNFEVIALDDNFKPTTVEMVNILQGKTYWEGVRPVDCFSSINAAQTTAASQRKTWDNGLNYPGGLSDGSDDFEFADLPDIINGPCTWWVKVNAGITAGMGGYVFCRNLADSTTIQYGLQVPNTGGSVAFWLENQALISAPHIPNRDVVYAFTLDGTTLTGYRVLNGVLSILGSAQVSGPLTSRPNKLLDARSNSADGSTRAVLFKGQRYEIGIYLGVLAPWKIQRLGEV